MMRSDFCVAGAHYDCNQITVCNMNKTREMDKITRENERKRKKGRKKKKEKK